MSEFSLVPLGQLAEIRMGQSPDSTYVFEGSEQGVPFLQGNAEFGVKHPAAKYSCTQPAKIAEQGSSLISVRAPVGETNIADQFYCIGRGLAAVKFHRYGASLGRELLSFSAKSLDKVSQGTTFAAIGGADLRTLLVADIPSQEARLLERVLDTLDTQIQKTEALIAKLEKVKEGLLHGLLTRGIDENGQLRPSPEQAPELYKESPLGLIPKGWSAACLSDLLASVSPAMRSGPFGSALLKDELVESGAPLLGIDNVKVEEFSDKFSRFVTPEKFAELSRYAVRPNDIMITIMGTVGRCCLVPEDIGDALSSKHTWTLTLDQENYSPCLAMLQINYMPWVLKHFSRDQQGGTMSAIRSETLTSLILPVPPRHEQAEIELRLLEMNKRIASEITALGKMHLQKSGLMEDLITGRVRVTPLLDQAQNTTPA